MTTLVRIHANLGWKVLQGKGGNWIGVCDPLKLTVQGETWADLMENIGHTLDAVLRDLLSSNELPRFLQDHGWQVVGGKIPERPDHPDDVRFDVPFIPAMMGANDPQRRVYQ
jgi:predicted RNase H-like HicB family nuclease